MQRTFRPTPAPLALAILAAAGCARLGLPFTVAQLQEASARQRPGPVLVHYLAQPDADPSACDLQNAAGHVARLDRDLVERLVDALVAGRVSPAVFEGCALRLWNDAHEPVALALLARATEALADELPGVDADDAVADRVEALHRFLAQRPPAEALDSPLGPVLARLVERIDADRARGRLGPRARQLGAAVMETVGMDLGLLGGARLTPELLDTVTDEPLLARLGARLPTQALRDAARRRRIRLHVLRSRFPEVRERAAQVEATVMELGRHPVAPQGEALRRTWVEAAALDLGVLVRQDLGRQRTTLLSYQGNNPGESVLPTLDLKGLLRFEVAGLSWPITLCAPAATLPVDPCLDAGAFALGNPMATLDEDGVVHFVDDVPLGTPVQLLRSQTGFTLQPTYEHRTLTQFALPWHFERPQDLVLQGRPGAPGPDLRVEVEPLAGRLLLTTTSRDTPKPWLAVVELADARDFHVVSQGGAGSAGTVGTRGADGTPGLSGSPASCPSMNGTAGGSGGAGASGGPGGAGGKGFAGGAIEVVLRCEPASCQELEPLVRAMVVSKGGAGGSGGAGGQGGQGGAGGQGGSGTSCYQNGRSTYLSSGMSGMRGANGSPGNQGPSGASGESGSVRFRTPAGE